MSEEATPMDFQDYLTPSDLALKNAWSYRDAFGAASNRQKKQTVRTRHIVINLTFLATSTAAVATMTDWADWVDTVFVVLLLILPIGTGLAMRYASTDMPSTMWVVSRVTAETIRREIYLYRTQAGMYSDKVILKEVEQINTATSPDELPPLLNEVARIADDELKLMKLLRQRKLNQRVADAKERINQLDKVVPYLNAIEEQKSTQASTSKDEVNRKDDLYSLLSFREYVEYRLDNQHDWYLQRVRTDKNKYDRWRLIALAITFLGAVFGGLGAFWVGWQSFVVISVAFGTAVATYMQLKMFGQTYSLYHRTADKLKAERANWEIYSPDDLEKPENKAFFVAKIEDILQEERTLWIQRALQSQISAEMALVGNIDDWVRSQFELVIKSQEEIDKIFGEPKS